MSFAGARQCSCFKYESYLNPRRPVRNWVVLQRKENRSAYNGTDYHQWNVSGDPRRVEKSRWSHVLCLTCGSHWRTQAGYVDRLPDLEEETRRLCYGRLRQGQRADRDLLEKISSPSVDGKSSPVSRKRKSSPSARSSRRSPRRPARSKR